MGSGSYSTAAEEIKNRCNIVDLISPLVPLKRAGSNYKGCCPFHKEKTPSFVVSESRQTFHCFGCGAHGDAVVFYMKFFTKTFREAVEELAGRFGVEIDRNTGEQLKQREPYYETNRLAARFFFDIIRRPGCPGFSYMQKRGIEPKTMQKFGIGFAPDAWTELSDSLQKQGIARELLTELGLSSEKNGRVYDKFRGRVMFPIINTRGSVIGFGGRILGDGEPKYLNSPESLVFQKKNNLFGLNLTRSAIQSEGFAVIVEGYMDVVSLYQAGVCNVAASLGTALTEQQAKLLSRYTKKAVLCYDADNAGRKAALRGIDVLRSASLDVRVLHVDEGKDPDEYIKKNGKDAFLELIRKKSMSAVDYKAASIALHCDMHSTDGRLAFFKEAAAMLGTLSPVEIEVYIQKIAADYGFSEGALRNQVRDGNSGQMAPVQMQPEEPEQPAAKISEAAMQLEKTVLRLIMLKAAYYKEAEALPALMSSEEAKGIMRRMGELFKEGEEFELLDMKDRLSEKEYAYLQRILDTVQTGGDDRRAFDDCIEKVQRSERLRRIQEIGTILSMADGTADMEYIAALTKELTELNRLNKR